VFGCGGDWDAVAMVQPWAGCRGSPHTPPNHARAGAVTWWPSHCERTASKLSLEIRDEQQHCALRSLSHRNSADLIARTQGEPECAMAALGYVKRLPILAIGKKFMDSAVGRNPPNLVAL
jgi:hypothetical protein